MVETLSVFLNREPLGLVTLEGKGDRYGLAYAQSSKAEDMLSGRFSGRS